MSSSKYIIRYSYYNKARYAYVYLRHTDGKEHRIERLGKNLSKRAIQAKFNRYKILNEHPSVGLPFKLIVQQYIDHRSGLYRHGEITASTLQQDKNYTKHCIGVLGNLYEIRYKDIATLTKALSEEPLKNKYRNAILSFVRATLVWAKKMDLIAYSPPEIDYLSGDPSLITPLTTEQTDRLLQCILTHEFVGGDVSEWLNVNRSYTHAIFKFWLNTGLRPREIYDLDWADISYDQSSIFIRSTNTLKSGKSGGRSIPFTEQMKKILSPYRKASGSVLTVTVMHLRSIIRNLTKATGIHFAPYTLRKTFGSRMAERGMPLISLSKIMGHSTTITTQKYYIKLSDSSLLSDLEQGGCI